MHTSSQEIDKAIHMIVSEHQSRLEKFRSLNPEAQGEVVLHVPKHVQHELLSGLSKPEAIAVLEQLDPDQATDILQTLSPRKSQELVEELSVQLKNDVAILLNFDPETAAGLMSLDYIQVDANDHITSIARKFKVHEKRTGKMPAIMVMENGELIGYLPGHELGFALPSDKARKYIRRIRAIEQTADTDEVLEMFRRHPHNKLAVLGENGNVMGVIYSDDVLRVLKERETSTLYDFAGVHEEESVFDPAPRKINFRYKWLILNLATAFLAAFTVGLFESTISKYVLLAVYMPIVAGMGGNAATQTLAVMVRGITLGQIRLRTVARTLKSELNAGFVNGLINGLIITVVVVIKDRDIRIAIILAAAMVINLLIAAFFGTTVPLIMKRLGKDPAASATIFITTATDVFGFMAFLGLATVLLG